MADIPLWTFPLSTDFREIFAWGLVKFPPEKSDHEMKFVMEAAVRDKSAEVALDRSQLDYLHRMGCGAAGCDEAAVRFAANRFLNAVEKLIKMKPNAIPKPGPAKKPKQKSMFD